MLFGDKTELTQNELLKAMNLKEEDIYDMSFKYLHGKIQDINGYDIVYSNNEDEANVLNNIPGIYDVDVCVINSNPILRVKNTIYKAKAYIWKPESYKVTKGLIVLKDDEDAIKHAEECYKEKRAFI